MTDPTQFLSRTGYREVKAASATQLTPGRLISGVLFDGTIDITLSTTGVTEGTNLYFTDERAQDAVGNILTDTATIDFTYTDVTPTITADLKNTTVSAGSYGSASAVGTFTVDAQGRLTAASNAPISITASQITNFSSEAQNTVGGILVDTATIDLTFSSGPPSVTADLKNTAVTPGSYTAANITVDAQGRLTAAASTGIFVSSDQTITSGGLLTLAHSLGVGPYDIHAFIVCQTGELNYVAGDVLRLGTESLGNNQGIAIIPDATNINIRFGSAAKVFNIIDKTTGNDSDATNANWLLRIYARAL